MRPGVPEWAEGQGQGWGSLLPTPAPPQHPSAARSDSWSHSSQEWERVYPKLAPSGIKLVVVFVEKQEYF